MRKVSLKTFSMGLAFLLILSFCAVIAMPRTVARAEGVEISKQSARFTWIDASVSHPEDYATNIVGFKIKAKLLKDHFMTYEGTEKYCGYGGENKPEGPYPTYMLLAVRGKHDTTTYNSNTFVAKGNYEYYVDDDLYKQEIVKMGIGGGSYVAVNLQNGKDCGNRDIKVNNVAEIIYQGKKAIFSEGNPFMTLYGYTSEFEIQSIEWIEGVPSGGEDVAWEKVESQEYLDVPTVEDSTKQNGFNYADISVPKTNKGPYPVALWIHGGAWLSGDRKTCAMNTTKEYLLSKGFAFVSLSYKLSTQTDSSDMTTVRNDSKGKQMIYDLKLAVRFLRANAAKYNLNTDFIAALGESAGAHLSLLLGTTNGKETHEDKSQGWANYSSDVQAMAVYSAPTDFVEVSVDSYDLSGWELDEYNTTAEFPLTNTTMKASNLVMAVYCLGFDYVDEHTINGFPDAELLEAQKFLSPYWQVDYDTPPMYLVHGWQDGGVYISHSLAMEEQAKKFLDEKDVKASFYLDAGHVDAMYFDQNAQYVSIGEFLIEKMTENGVSFGTGDGDDNSDKGCGCSSSILHVENAIVLLVLSVIIVAAVVLIVKSRKDSIN